MIKEKGKAAIKGEVKASDSQPPRLLHHPFRSRPPHLVSLHIPPLSSTAQRPHSPSRQSP